LVVTVTLVDSPFFYKVGEGKLPVKWMSPESLFERVCTGMVSVSTTVPRTALHCTAQSDVWSYGVLLWEILTWGDTPYSTVPTLDALLELIRGGYRLGRPPHCPAPLWGVVSSCWAWQPDQRPGWHHLTDSLHRLHRAALPGQYLELPNLPALPTPPSSREGSGDWPPPAPARSSTESGYQTGPTEQSSLLLPPLFWSLVSGGREGLAPAEAE